jgi:cytochrome P450
MRYPVVRLWGFHPYAAGHAPSNFARATEFIPERWLKNAPAEYKDDKLKSVQGVSLWLLIVHSQFSLGPRNCIGKSLPYTEMRLILARVLYSFNLELQEESKDWLDMKIYGFYEKPKLMVKLDLIGQ